MARDDLEDADQLRIGNEGIFMLTFFSEFSARLVLISPMRQIKPPSSLPSGVPVQLDRLLPLLLSDHLGCRPLRGHLGLRPLPHQMGPHS